MFTQVPCKVFRKSNIRILRGFKIPISERIWGRHESGLHSLKAPLYF